MRNMSVTSSTVLVRGVPWNIVVQHDDGCEEGT